VNQSRNRPSSALKCGGEQSVSLDERLWDLAQAGTRLRASWSDADRPAARLMEATAALQDLTINLAPDDESRKARLTELQELQAECEPGIRCAHNGPYLATNPETLLKP